MKRTVCGLDVHKDSVFCCIIRTDGQKIQHKFGVLTEYNEGVPLDLIMLITSHSDVKAMKPYLKGNLKGSNRVIEALNKASH